MEEGNAAQHNAAAPVVMLPPDHVGRRGSGSQRHLIRAGIVACCVAALLLCAISFRGEHAPAAGRAELLWDPYALEDSVASDHDLWGGRAAVADILRERSAHLATRVGRRFQDDERVGIVLGHAANVAFDTLVEIKRAMRGLQYESEDSVFNSKIEVAETMLAHLTAKLGISEIPPPPHTTRLASVKNAMRMARDLRMILSKIPTGSDARDFREARYNLAVYDLDQVSRQINEIMLMLSEDGAYEELQEPAFSRFDAVMADAQAGLADADATFGGGTDHNKAWKKATWEAKMNLLPRSKQIREQFKAMAKGEERRLSQRMSGPNQVVDSQSDSAESEELPIEKIIGDANPEMDVHEDGVHARAAPLAEDVPVVCVDAQDHGPHQDVGILCPHARQQKPAPEPREPQLHDDSGEVLIREAVAAAMKQDAIAESAHPALVDRLAERKIEAMAVHSVMNQLQHTESNRRFFVGQDGSVANLGHRVWRTQLKSSDSMGGRIQQLAMVPLSMWRRGAQAKKDMAKTRLAVKKARLQSLSAVPDTSPVAGEERGNPSHRDTRDDVTVAGEGGFSDGYMNHVNRGAEAADLEAKEEDALESKEGEDEGEDEGGRSESRGADDGEGQEEQAEGTGAYQTVNAEESGDVSSGSDWLTSPERSRQSPLPYDLQLEKDAVYQASKTGMIMELNHPGWQDSVENAASVAVDAAIRAETYNGGDALMLVERAAVEGATKAAKEMEIKAEGDGKAGEKELAIAQRVENSAVRAAIMAANEIQAEHNHKLVYMPHTAPVLAAQAMPQAPVQMTAPVQQSMPVQSPAAATMATGMPMLAGGGVLGGVAMANGQTFVPDAVQPVAGMVEGTMYVPE